MVAFFHVITSRKTLMAVIQTRFLLSFLRLYVNAQAFVPRNGTMMPTDVLFFPSLIELSLSSAAFFQSEANMFAVDNAIYWEKGRVCFPTCPSSSG